MAAESFLRPEKADKMVHSYKIAFPRLMKVNYTEIEKIAIQMDVE